MNNKKPIRERGKIRFSRYFQELEKGEAVAVVRESAMQPRFLKRIQGRTGVVGEKRGKAYIVKINDQKKEKTYIIEPIHLKKIKQLNKNDNQ